MHILNPKRIKIDNQQAKLSMEIMEVIDKYPANVITGVLLKILTLMEKNALPKQFIEK